MHFKVIRHQTASDKNNSLLRGGSKIVFGTSSRDCWGNWRQGFEWKWKINWRSIIKGTLNSWKITEIKSNVGISNKTSLSKSALNYYWNRICYNEWRVMGECEVASDNIVIASVRLARRKTSYSYSQLSSIDHCLLLPSPPCCDFHTVR